MNGIDPAQIVICVCGPLACWLVSSKTAKARLAGCILGLCAQPAWFWTTWEHQQWGIFALSLWYTASWARGVRNNAEAVRTGVSQ